MHFFRRARVFLQHIPWCLTGTKPRIHLSNAGGYFVHRTMNCCETIYRSSVYSSASPALMLPALAYAHPSFNRLSLVGDARVYLVYMICYWLPLQRIVNSRLRSS